MLLLVTTVAAATWVVDDAGPADFASIQDALDTAASGDTVYVRDGTYHEAWEDGFDGAVLAVPPGVTVVGESVDGVVVYSAYAGAPVRTSALYLLEGSGDTFVGQLTIVNATPGTEAAWWGEEVAYNAVTQCCGYHLGSGTATIQRVVFSLPTAHPKLFAYVNWGGQVLTVTNVTVDFDTTTGDVSYVNYSNSSNLIRNTILANTSGDGRYWGSYVGSPQITTAYTDLWNGGTWGVGDIDADPLFVGGGDYRLAAGSPAIDAGDPDPAYDDEDGTRNDMGAFGGPPIAFPTDADGDGYSDDGVLGGSSDCDDADATVYPGATETCDGVDEDCDGAVDEDAVGLPRWYLDGDGDGYGDASAYVDGCEAPAGYVADGTDCDDFDALRSPGATEVCDELDRDDDCDALADDADPDVADATRTAWYLDEDGDGYGTTDTRACELPVGHAASGADCDDADPTVYPGAPEDCRVAVDNNCDGSMLYADADGDGTLACDDCDDGDPEAAVGGTEVPDDGRDGDCDGAELCYRDADGDGYRPDDADPIPSPDLACDGAGEAAAGDPTGDCDDGDPSVHPAAPEIEGDAIDQDCDGADLPGAGADDTATPDTDGSGTPGADDGSKPTDGCGCASGGEGTAGVWLLGVAVLAARRRSAIA